MCRDLAESVGSREQLLVVRKRNEFLSLSIVLRILQLLITLEPLVQFRWGFEQRLPVNEDFSQIENLKCHTCLTDFPR